MVRPGAPAVVASAPFAISDLAASSDRASLPKAASLEFALSALKL